MEHELALLDLPLQVPPVHVDALWHRQATQNSGHRWLRQSVERASAVGFRAPDAASTTAARRPSANPA
jgi:hypothetical protein